ncbi:MAG: orotate phosphoribosyltransferase [Candidatus Korarchaeum sp.]|nr:orotate phosphoribosyltransferase [Candidatus Korarchaeum sp.]MDW8035206.1 orotate phosphoribosyltransferase [Candidatus Korarchaeum sp.]
MDAYELGILLLSKGMLRFGEFTLTSGRRSSIYVDLRPLPSFPGEFLSIAEEIARRIGNDDLGVCGVAVGGLPLATAIAMKLRKPLIYVRKERKEHGTESLLEGFVDRRGYVVIDDVATTGGSIIHAAKTVRSYGSDVREAWVVVDRMQGAAENLKAEKIELKSLATLPDVVSVLIDSLSDEERQHALRYLREVGL